MTNTPHNIRPGMTGDMGVTPNTTPEKLPEPAVDPQVEPLGEPQDDPDGVIKDPVVKDPMELEVDKGPNLTNPQDEK